MNTEIQVRPTRMDADIERVVKTLARIGDRVSDNPEQPLVVGHYYQEGDYPFPSFSYYYLAQKVKGRMLRFIPRTRKRVLVSMNDPHRNYGGEVGCTVLDANIKNVVEEEIRHHAQTVSATKVTILDDNNPLVI